MSRTKRQAVVVLGMHRSGTSALAGVLGLMGARLPARLMPAGPGNPKGYFEPGHIVVIHDRILATAGTSWAGWEPISEAWLRSDACRPFVDELAAAVLEDYGESGLFMVKDPRMCRLMPLWFRVLERIDAQASFLLPFRNPVEVARSVERREGLPLPYGCVAWLRYVLEAEQQTRGHPRAFLSYGDLVADPRAAIEHAVAALPLDWPGPLDKVAGEIREFIDPGLRHQIAGETAIDDMGEYSPWLRQALGHYQALARAGDEGAPAALDALREQLDAADALFSPALKHDIDLPTAEQEHVRAAREREADLQRTELVVLQRSLAGARARATRLAGELDARAAELAAAMEQGAHGEAQLEAARQRGAQLEQRLATRSQEVEALRADLAAAVNRAEAESLALSRARADAEARASSLQAVVAAMRRSRSWQLTAPLRWVKRLVTRWYFNSVGFSARIAWRALRAKSRAPLRVWRDARVIARSGRFDRTWYLAEYPDVAAFGLDPVRHYVMYGATEGRDPSPSFSTTDYLAQNADVGAAGMNPLAHHVRFGANEDRAYAPSQAVRLEPAAEREFPPPASGAVAVPTDAERDLFVQWCRDSTVGSYPSRDALAADCRLLRESGLFDAEAYRLAAGIDARTDPVEHYLREGWRAGLEPGPAFQGTSLYPYYCSAGHPGPPAVTYLKLRASGGPAYATLAEAKHWAAVIRTSHLFAERQYAARFERLGALDPALHYVIVGEPAGLPPSDGFDPVYYRRRYPDLAHPGVSPLGHYLTGGRREGRRALSTAARLKLGGRRLGGRETVLVVSHDASRTGAPILAWNIATRLRKRYNVVGLSLSGGELLDVFAAACSAVIGPLSAEDRHPVELEFIVRRLRDAYPIAYAVVNSIESRQLIPALAAAFVPVVSLIHEFASYTRPPGAMNEGLSWSTQIVFSSDLTCESAKRENPLLANRKIQVLPQGRCELPVTRQMPASEVAMLRQRFRPKGQENALVVLGAGFVHIRKGVDLFLSCAAAVAAARPKRPVRFIWIGDGYDPLRNVEYSSYLAEQIARAGLEQSVAILDAIEDFDHAYGMADVFLLSSRLDPMPNVTIDAAFRGMPVVCFEGASGIASLLAAEPSLRSCVVPHLDTHAAAQVILGLADDEAALARLSADIRRFAASTFDMEAYVGRLDELGREGADLMRQRAQDFATIRDDPLFDAAMFCPPSAPCPTREDAIRLFLARWAAVGTSPKPAVDFFFRRPCPGFHPQIYAHENAGRYDAARVNPLADFIRSSKPDGAWRHDVLTSRRGEAPRAVALRAALHVHFYYPELAADLLGKLSVNRSRIDLLLTTDTSAKERELRDAARHYERGGVKIHVVPNRGRDIGPFLTALKEALAGYDVVGHLHAKRSAWDMALGERRREFLWQNLAGGQQPMADLILQRFADDATLGIVFPEDPALSDWDDNLAIAAALAGRMKLPGELPPFLDFPGGTMFWARPAALKPLFDLGLDWHDYPDEPVPLDGTILHAIERLLPFVARQAGYGFLTTHLPDVTW